jgi:hypothetical protein
VPERPSLGLREEYVRVLVALAAFGLYWSSSLLLDARHATIHFGADTWFYTELAKGNVVERIASDYHLDRIARFHLTTVVMAAGWMKVLSPLTAWIAPQYLLKGMFAAVGGIGVWAAMSAFAAALPRRQAQLWGVIYASSFAVWYFSSIEESKIVTATLSALYIATYLRLRQNWTPRGAVLLTAILLIACLNEVAAGLLVVIPLVDTLVQRGWDFDRVRWIVWHGLTGPIALAVLEGILRLRTGPSGFHPEGRDHFSMFLYYVSQNDYSTPSLYAFALKWVFFNIAAPTPHADHRADLSINYGGDFAPVLANYFSSPVSAGLVILFGVMLAAAVLPRYRAESLNGLSSVLLALLAYALLRGAFFLVFIPWECLLFSSSVTLAHLLLIGIPFAGSRFPRKQGLLVALAVLLFITNGAFMVRSA